MKTEGAAHTKLQLPVNNQEIAAALEEVANLLEAQGANRFRVAAYRKAADTLRRLSQQVDEIIATRGKEGLLALPGIGESLARSIERLCRTGRLGLLQRLRGQAGPEHLFVTLPGIGLEFASRIHEFLGIESLTELEAAANDGRLSRVPGMGAKRIRGIRESLAGRFGRRTITRPSRLAAASQASVGSSSVSPPRRHIEQPTVGELLDVDREYREKAHAAKLPRIAPHRFNPGGEAWLPILHTERGPRHYTALFSNSAQAHEAGMTHDWVVIYRDDHKGDGQWTVITSQFGNMRGRRIVRGRETECAELYVRQKRPAGHEVLFKEY